MPFSLSWNLNLITNLKNYCFYAMLIACKCSPRCQKNGLWCKKWATLLCNYQDIVSCHTILIISWIQGLVPIYISTFQFHTFPKLIVISNFLPPHFSNWEWWMFFDSISRNPLTHLFWKFTTSQSNLGLNSSIYAYHYNKNHG